MCNSNSEKVTFHSPHTISDLFDTRMIHTTVMDGSKSIWRKGTTKNMKNTQYPQKIHANRSTEQARTQIHTNQQINER